MSIGIDFPLQDNNDTKDLFNLNKLNRNAIKANLILFLTTKKGSRYMRPNFGADLVQFIFEQKDNLQRDIIEEYIKKEVEQEFLNIKVNYINMEGNEEGNDYLLYLGIDFKYTNGNFEFNDLVTLEFVL